MYNSIKVNSSPYLDKQNDCWKLYCYKMSNNPKTLLVSHPMVQLILYTKAVYWQNCQQKNRFQMDSQFPAKKSIKIMSITLDGLPCKWTPNMAFYFEWIQTFLEHNLRWEIKDELISKFFKNCFLLILPHLTNESENPFELTEMAHFGSSAALTEMQGFLTIPNI